MRLLVFGRTGQVAQELARRAPDAAYLGRADVDLAEPEACGRAVARGGADAVINAAAFTAVDRAEAEEDLATTINGAAPGAMARACAELGIPFLHVSSDYVFDGTGQAPWRPDDRPGPIGAYGRSKLAGERSVSRAGGIHAILRTSWVFSAHGSNFVRTMLRLGAERDALRIVADQVGGPTPAAAIADALLSMAAALRSGGGPSGVYHFSGAPDVSWADFARAIFDRAGLDCAVEDIATADYPTPARRPLNSRLDCAATERDFGIARPDWRAGLDDVLKELGT